MKVGLIGYGYWGRIIRSNLDCEPMIFDPNVESFSSNLNNLLEESTHVFVASPAHTHFDIVSQALDKGCHVFCEKPLTTTYEQSKLLYKKADYKNLNLYVDWIFTCNPAVRMMKNMLAYESLGKLTQASMNRLNLGPVREDVSARLDLSSHDLSILCYLINGEIKTEHADYKEQNQEKAGTCFTEVIWKEGRASINSSWNYPVKNRTCVFSFENATIHWDDADQYIFVNGKSIEVSDKRSPLEISINEFLESSYDKDENKSITLKVMKLLEDRGNTKEIS